MLASSRRPVGCCELLVRGLLKPRRAVGPPGACAPAYCWCWCGECWADGQNCWSSAACCCCGWPGKHPVRRMWDTGRGGLTIAAETLLMAAGRVCHADLVLVHAHQQLELEVETGGQPQTLHLTKQ
eukprot:6190338-Pleurochrysis_carterae.AAC.1